MKGLTVDSQFIALRYAANLIFESYDVSTLMDWDRGVISTLNLMTHPDTVVRDMFDFSDHLDVADELNRRAFELGEMYLEMKKIEDFHN